MVATVPVPGGALEVLEGGAIDPEAAKARVEKKRKELQADLDKTEAKLGNAGFVDKAPPAVVAAEREKADRLRQELDAL